MMPWRQIENFAPLIAFVLGAGITYGSMTTSLDNKVNKPEFSRLEQRVESNEKAGDERYRNIMEALKRIEQKVDN